MYNLDFNFSHPWLLLLLIPAFGLTLWGYFRLDKKYRKTRKRITSMVLHLAVMVFAVTVLSGIQLDYQTANKENEIILLVDVSQTTEQSRNSREDFIRMVIEESRFDNFKIGIVTFGFDQVYAAPLTNNTEDIYDQYLRAELPDTTATNIAAALQYTRGLFNNPKAAKIVLISDGKETDEQALAVIGAVTANGIKMDAVNISTDYTGDDVQIVDVEFPDHHLSVGEQYPITVTIKSKSAISADIELYDNDILSKDTGIKAINLIAGTQTVVLTHSFESEGLHKLLFKVTAHTDEAVVQNNQYYSYHYLEVFNQILILERRSGESDMLMDLLAGEGIFNVEVMNILTDETVPQSIEQLLEYDQVILNNIANKDMPNGFDDLLYSYVNIHGGGLFTVGGNDASGNANAYNRTDMYGSLYQQMLPVQAINYTPPVGVMVIIDKSGSMAAVENGRSRLEWAKSGTISCLRALTERDYIGVMTLDGEYDTVLPLTPRPQEVRILAAIDTINEANGATVFPAAIRRAGEALRALTNVDKRHILVVTDGGVPEEQAAEYKEIIEELYNLNGITLSIVTIGMTPGSAMAQRMQEAVDLADGRLYALTNSEELIGVMREELNTKEIKEVNYESFNPTIYNPTSPLVTEIERGEDKDRHRMTVSLDGFYGVKAREGIDLVLVGEYEVPIYAQWKFGKGMVGSFMCDLNGTWSTDFLTDLNGRLFITNVVNNLMPVQNIRAKGITIDLSEDNYINKLSVYTALGEGEYLQGQIIEAASEEPKALSLNSVTAGEVGELPYYVTYALTDADNYSRVTFVVKKGGTYKIVIEKFNAEGVVIDSLQDYKTFSYSQEYDNFIEETQDYLTQKLKNLAEQGNGALIFDNSDPMEIYEGFIIDIDKTYPLEFPFIILALVLFLADIAVRKFKFKWPHEIYREYKQRKEFK